MEKSQYEICTQVLKRLEQADVLKHVVIIGSWAMLAYEKYFKGIEYHPSIRTRDMDILVPIPQSFDRSVDLEKILKDLNFVVGFKGRHGHMRFVHRDLFLEFLVPERGRGSSDPYPLPELGANAQRLRYLDFLLQKQVKGELNGIPVLLPHPTCFALHKLIVSTRRTKAVKAENDRRQGTYILDRLLALEKESEIQETFDAMPKSWQKPVRQALRELPDEGRPLDSVIG